MVRVLGIDPGSNITGYGLVDVEGQRNTYVASGCLRLKGDDLGEKLAMIYRELGDIIVEHAPNELAVERVFMSRNADSALKLGQARGAAICAGVTRGLPLFEYTPRAIKQAVVGKGGAGKDQVQHMVTVLLNLDKSPQADAADALAVALCHGHTRMTQAYLAGRVAVNRGGRG